MTTATTTIALAYRHAIVVFITREVFTPWPHAVTHSPTFGKYNAHLVILAWKMLAWKIFTDLSDRYVLHTYFGVTIHKARICHSVTFRSGVGVTKPISSVPLFFVGLKRCMICTSLFNAMNCSALSKHALAIEYHVYIWQVSPQVILPNRKFCLRRN